MRDGQRRPRPRRPGGIIRVTVQFTSRYENDSRACINSVVSNACSFVTPLQAQLTLDT